jgi:hypothetical protein
MKKLSGVIALLLSITIFLILRQLMSSHAKAPRKKADVSAIVRENILFGSMMMQ